jgi:APA family basic amino acid/polyamine antiporter
VNANAHLGPAAVTPVKLVPRKVQMPADSESSTDGRAFAPHSSLKRILGVGFGLAVIFGGTVGVGILRMPGTIAAQLGSFWSIMLVWTAGGCYALLGAVSIAELGTAMPQAGGFYIYSKRAFGPVAGFAVGWADWLNNCAVVAYASVAAAEYITTLVRNSASWQTPVALVLLLLFSALHWTGLRPSSTIQQLTSSVTAMTFLLLAAACLMHPARADHSVISNGFGRAGGLFQMLVPMVAAIRAIVVTYDGWYEAIYFTEEDTNVSKHLPRTMIGGVLIVLALYLLMNLAFLHVLSMTALASSKLPAADAARIVFPHWSGTFVTGLALLTLLSLINAVLLGAPRILLAIGRDGVFGERAAQVGPGGTPRPALLASAATAAVFIASGKFEDIIAVAAILVAAMYCVNYIAVIVLRLREPEMIRPFRAWGYPVTTVIVLICSLLFLVVAAHDDTASALRAGVLLAIAIPAYLWLRWRHRQHRPRKA